MESPVFPEHQDDQELLAGHRSSARSWTFHRAIHAHLAHPDHQDPTARLEAQEEPAALVDLEIQDHLEHPDQMVLLVSLEHPAPTERRESQDDRLKARTLFLETPERQESQVC